jgi:hypothetical protein
MAIPAGAGIKGPTMRDMPGNKGPMMGQPGGWSAYGRTGSTGQAGSASERDPGRCVRRRGVHYLSVGTPDGRGSDVQQSGVRQARLGVA